MVNPEGKNSLIEVANPLSGHAASEQFVSEYWQRRPVLVRGAFSAAELDALTAPRANPADAMRELSVETLWALAGEEETEARLIRRRGSKWALEHGPFEPEQAPGPRQKRWTLLVQSVDHFLEDASNLLHRFNFLPQSRLDDLMISVASDQGGVGPHKDSYDVFLVQLEGRRHWTLGAPGEHELQPNQPVRLVSQFETYAEVLVEPGDMLYVPPGWIHDGVAQGPCMTASIGFRAPTRGELLTAWLQASADLNSEDESTRAALQYSDQVDATSARRWRKQSAQLPDAMLASLTGWLSDWQPRQADMHEFLGCYLTEPKASVWFERPDASQCRRFNALAKRNGVKLDRRTRISFSTRVVYINGEPWASERALSPVLKQLANERSLDPAGFARLSESDQQSLGLWFESGWLHAFAG